MADKNIEPAKNPADLCEEALDQACGGAESIFGKVVEYVQNEVSIPASQRNDPQFRNWTPSS